MPEPLVLTVEEAAAVLRIGRTAAYGAVRAGDIPVVRIGRSLRVPRHAIDTMLGIDPSTSEATGRQSDGFAKTAGGAAGDACSG